MDQTPINYNTSKWKKLPNSFSVSGSHHLMVSLQEVSAATKKDGVTRKRRRKGWRWWRKAV